jgi:hypothetical protein
MNNRLPVQDFESVGARKPAPVIHLRSSASENQVEKRNSDGKKTEKKIPLFYTKPIFKTKKYDLL